MNINIQMIALLIIMAMLGFMAGWVGYGVLAPLTADKFIDACDSIYGAGQWTVNSTTTKTCVPLQYIVIPDETNLTIPVRSYYIP